MSEFKRHEKIAIMLAGLETPGDLTPEEQEHNREDIMDFLQAEYEKCKPDEEDD